MRYRLEEYLGKLAILAVFLIFGYSLHGGSENRTLAEWTFDRENDLYGWIANGHIAKLTIKDGALSCRTIGDDPILELQSPLEFAATPRQFIEVRLKAEHNGLAEFFWSNTKEGRYSGFSGEKHTPISSCRRRAVACLPAFSPFWQTEGKIIRLRFDLFGASAFSLQSIRIAELPSAPLSPTTVFDFTHESANWLATGFLSVSNTPAGIQIIAKSSDDFLLGPPVEVMTSEKSYVSFRMSATNGKKARLVFASDKVPGMHTLNFPHRFRRKRTYLQPGYARFTKLEG